MTFRLADHCGQYLSELAVEDHRIYVLDGDLADSDGAVHFALKHPERFMMAGIAEQCMVSVAAGMASCGLRPWVFSFGAFLCYRAYDQIRVCLSQSHQPVTLVGSHTGGLAARNGKTHAALNDISLMASLPHMQVWSPGDANDLKFAMHQILADSQPAYLRLPRRPLELLPGEASTCRWLGAPQPIALLGTGLGTHLALAVQEQLSQCDLSVGVFHCPRVSPLPRQALAEAFEHCEMIFVIEDHYKFGGLASLLQQLDFAAKIISFGWPNDWSGASGNDEDLLQRHELAPDQIARDIFAAVENSTRVTSGGLLS
jgi:transketolase